MQICGHFLNQILKCFYNIRNITGLFKKRWGFFVTFKIIHVFFITLQTSFWKLRMQWIYRSTLSPLPSLIFFSSKLWLWIPSFWKCSGTTRIKHRKIDREHRVARVRLHVPPLHQEQDTVRDQTIQSKKDWRRKGKTTWRRSCEANPAGGTAWRREGVGRRRASEQQASSCL
jgi:hypothetical protein